MKNHHLLHTGALLLAGSVNANATLIVENAVYAYDFDAMSVTGNNFETQTIFNIGQFTGASPIDAIDVPDGLTLIDRQFRFSLFNLTATLDVHEAAGQGGELRYTMQADVSYANIHLANGQFLPSPEPFSQTNVSGVAALRNFSAFETWNRTFAGTIPYDSKHETHINWEGLDLSQALSLGLFTQLSIWLFDTSESYFTFTASLSPFTFELTEVLTYEEPETNSVPEPVPASLLSVGLAALLWRKKTGVMAS